MSDVFCFVGNPELLARHARSMEHEPHPCPFEWSFLEKGMYYPSMSRLIAMSRIYAMASEQEKEEMHERRAQAILQGHFIDGATIETPSGTISFYHGERRRA